ncbi:hypothetical protein Tco_0722300 [Tanacetum coccineum]
MIAWRIIKIEGPGLVDEERPRVLDPSSEHYIRRALTHSKGIMSTSVFVDPECFTKVDEAQSSRVPVPLPEDPYEAIRWAYLDGTDTESEPFEDLIDIETLETAHMAVRASHVMSSGLSAIMANVAAMSESSLRKRFRSSYESSPSVSPPDLPSWKRYRATSELVEDNDENDDEEDEEIEESIDSNSVSEDAEDEGPTAKDKDPATKDEGFTAGVEGPDMHDEGYGLDDESHGRDDESRGIDDEGHSVKSDRLGLEEEEEVAPGVSSRQLQLWGQLTFEVRQGSGSAPEFERPEPTLTTWTDPKDVNDEGFLTELGAQVEMQGGLIRDHAVRLEELPPALFERSLEYEQERVAVTFGAIWRPVLALEAWAGQTDAQRAALWHAISDVQGENQDLWLQLAEERRARLELAEVVDGMRRGQEPRGGA